MLPCIYTTQKTKKLKKWIDGFLLPIRKGLRLYDVEKQFLYNSESYKIIDDYIDTSNYLIYLDDINKLITGNSSLSLANENTIVAENYETKNTIEKKELEDGIDSSMTYETVHNYDFETEYKIENDDEKKTKKYEKTKGRSINDINDLFNK